MFSQDSLRGPIKLRRVGKSYLFGERSVVIVHDSTPERLKALEDAGFHPIDVEALRRDVMRGNQARNILKSIGLDVPTNKEYFRRDRDDLAEVEVQDS